MALWGVPLTELTQDPPIENYLRVRRERRRTSWFLFNVRVQLEKLGASPLRIERRARAHEVLIRARRLRHHLEGVSRAT